MNDKGYREQVLAKVRLALGEVRPQPVAARPEAEKVPDLLAMFVTEFEKVGGRLIRTRNALEATDHIVGIASSRKIDRVGLSDARILDEISLQQGLQQHFPESGSVVRVDRTWEKAEMMRVLGDVGLGVTSCQFAVASTGTFVLSGETEVSRFLSLLPPIHVVVFNQDQLVGTLDDVLETMSLQRVDSVVTLVTGPSRTADIELTLTKGVHGPREIHAICVELGNR